jgi:hypothetical protein
MMGTLKPININEIDLLLQDGSMIYGYQFSKIVATRTKNHRAISGLAHRFKPKEINYATTATTTNYNIIRLTFCAGLRRR